MSRLCARLLLALCCLSLSLPSVSAPTQPGAQQYIAPGLTAMLFPFSQTDPDTGRRGVTLSIFKEGQPQPLLSQSVWLRDHVWDDITMADGRVTATPEQWDSWVRYTDMNFDGQPDLALFDGDHSCYGGPSYKVYLAQGDAFVPQPEWDELLQNSCGFADIDTEHQQLHTMSKSGCCWHQYSSFAVNGMQLILVQQKTIAHGVFMGLLREESVTTYEPASHISSEHHTLYLDEETAPEAGLTVALQNGSHILLFDLNQDTDAATVEPQLLWITGLDRQVTLLWPPATSSNTAFTGQATSPTLLRFQHEGTDYALGQRQQQHGLWLTRAGHTQFIPSLTPFDLSPWLTPLLKTP